MKIKAGCPGIISKTILIFSLFLTSACAIALAEDYPSNFLGPGYREYLSGKIQEGYYVDTFAKLDVRLKTKIDKRNQIEDILNNSYQARPETTYSILSAEYEKWENQRETLETIEKTRQAREKNAAANTDFYYIAHPDGKKEFFRDGLLVRIENEIVKDQFGNQSRKNTYNIRYNDQRLMIGYESKTTNAFGDITYNLFTCEYTGDSVYYGTKDTVANKLMSRYTLTEIDASGHTTVTNWIADGYVGKFLSGFKEAVDSEVYGHSEVHRYDIIYDTADPDRPTAYKEDGARWGYGERPENLLTWHTERTDIEYLQVLQDDGSLTPIATQWHEIYTDSDGNFKEQDIKNKYYVSGTNAIILSTISTYTSRDVTGAISEGWNKIVYDYDKTGELESASGTGGYTSTDVDGTTTSTSTVTDTYEIIHGHAKVSKTHTDSKTIGPGGTITKEDEDTFTYDQWGLHQLDAKGVTVGTTVGPGGDKTYFYAIKDYTMVLGETKLTDVTSVSYLFDIYNESTLGALVLNDLTDNALLKQYQDNADSYSTKTMTYKYDANGRLEDATATTDTYAHTITGDVTHTNIKEEYEIRFNQAFLSYETIYTTGENTVSGDTWEELEKLRYKYGEYTSQESGNSAKYALIGINQEEVTLSGVTAAGRISISKNIFKTVTTTTTTKSTYEIKYGQSYITHSVLVSETDNQLGSYAKKTQVSDYTYAWKDFNGQQYYVATTQKISTTSEGYNISGDSWHYVTPETYTLTFQNCEYNGREYWGIPEGTKIETSYTISGSNQYNDVYSETITNKYEYKYGQPWLTESSSTKEASNAKHDKKKSTTTSTTTYTYGDITLDGKTYYGMLSYSFTTKASGTDKDGKKWSSESESYSITYQQCEYEGKKYWGIPEGTKVETSYKTTNDGKNYTVTASYEIKFGQLLLMKSTSKGDGGTSTTTNNYDWITFKGKQYYAIKSQTYDLDGHKKTFNLSEETLNGVTYWGLKEGSAGGGWKVEEGSISYTG